MSDYGANRAWADGLMPAVKRILGEQLLLEAPVEEDRDHNTDLIVLRMEPLRIGCRVRRHKYLAGHHGDFTVRAAIRSGGKTELAKIREGWGDILFYGFADAGGRGVAYWTLIDLAWFRRWCAWHLARYGTLPGREYPNRDGSSTLRAFPIAGAPRKLVLARGEVPPAMPGPRPGAWAVA